MKQNLKNRCLLMLISIVIGHFASKGQFTPNGINDTIFDREGNKYALIDQMINPPSGYQSINLRPAATVTCAAGYFVLHFAPNSVFTIGANALAYQNVVCQVYTDISNFINSPLSAPTNTVKVNIYCGNTPAGSGAIASASSYYIVPLAPASSNPGLTDNGIFKAIITGIDPFSLMNIAVTSVPPSFYHGVISLNPAFNYFSNLGSTAVPPAQDDLYSIMLHEALHALGFASLIDNNGMSKFGTANNYYATYDKFLTNSSSSPLLTSSTSSCSTGNMAFSGALTQICPGACTTSINTNLTNCTQAARFVAPGVNVAVYTPNCWESGSSLSHFEDICSVPAGFSTTCAATPPNNDLYYAMSNSNGGGVCGVKRYIQEEERLALCNIGYSVKSSNTSPVAGAAYTYTGGACSGAPVIGVDDGIVNGVITFTAINNISIPISTSITANDIASLPVTAGCFSLVYSQPFVTLGFNSTQLNVSTSGSPNNNSNCGIVVIKYIPKISPTVFGNPTYIYIDFQCPNVCNPPNSCDLVQNGGFEGKLSSNSSDCGNWAPVMTPVTNPMNKASFIQCWSYIGDLLSPFYTSPDVFTKGCTFPSYDIGNPASGVSNTYNNDPSNNTAIGIGSSLPVVPSLNEVIRNHLSTPLVPTNTYVASFWMLKKTPNDFVITLASTPSFSAAMSSLGTSTLFPGTYNVLTNFTVTNLAVGLWAKQTATFVFSSPGNAMHNTLMLGFDPFASAALPNGSNNEYVVFDDVSILPLSAYVPFSLPDAFCNNNSIIDLAQYAGSFQSGVFSGTGVTQVGSTYNFNTPPYLPPGIYNVALTYTTAGGCVNTVNAITNVSGIATTTNAATCSGGNYTLAASNFSAGTTYTWLPSGSNASSISVNPSVSTVYTLIATSGSCTNQYTTAINVYATPTVSPVSPICIGNLSAPLNANLVTGSPIGGAFSGNNILTQSCAPPFGNCYYINLAPPVTATAGIYNYTYTMPANPAQNYNCPVSTTFNVQYVTPLNVSINAIPNNCFVSGQSYTLQGSATPTAGVTLSYTWQPSGSNSNSIVISPSTNSIYTLTMGNGGCTRNSTLFVLVNTPVTFVNPPTQICTYQSILNLESYLSASTPTGGSWSSPSGLGTFFSPSPGITNLNVNPGLTPLGTHTITYSYVSLTNTTCLISGSFTINVGAGFTLNGSPTQTYCANVPGANATVFATASPSTGVSYLWQPGSLTTQSIIVSPPSQTIYTVTATLGFCSFTATSQVDTRTNCCVAANYINTPTLTTGIYSGSYAINNDITIVGNVKFDGEYKIAPNVNIFVTPGSSFMSDRDGMHLYSCNDMWQGITVSNGAYLRLKLNDFIEDAKEAVYVNNAVVPNTTLSPNYILDINGAVFNRNYIGIKIHNYNQPVGSPYLITNNVFSCRQLPFTSTTWPNSSSTSPGLRAITGSTNSLASPYGMQGYTSDVLKAPYAGIPSYAGVWVESSGVTTAPTSTAPTFYTILVGDPFQATNGYFNLFDNLLYGIYATNASVSSFNNTFQNIIRAVIPTPRPNIQGGWGIYYWDANTGNPKLITTTHPSGSQHNGRINKFYDCYGGLYLNNLYSADVQYADFRSSQSTAATPTNALLYSGGYGVVATTGIVKDYKISNNKMRNLENGITLNTSVANMQLPGQPTYGQYLGKADIISNELTAGLTLTSSITNLRFGHGISVSGYLGTNASFREPNAEIRIEANRIYQTYRGINMYNYNFNGYKVSALTNTIQLRVDPVANQQYGIYAANCIDNIINTNNITGFNITNTLVAGVYSSLCDNEKVQCNTITNVFTGFDFNGLHTGAFWRDNTMTTNRRGFQLSNTAKLGTQGSFNSPSDNKWAGSWVGNFGTWVDATSTATDAPLFIRNQSTYFPPNNNGGAFPTQFYGAANTLSFASSSAPFFNCTTNGGGGGGCPTCRVALMTDVATDNTTYTVNPVETAELNKDIVYNSISIQSQLSNANANLSGFYANQQNGVRGTYKLIENNILQGNFGAANSQISGFNPNTNIEQNHKLFYQLLRAYKTNGKLSLAENLQLLILSHQCPFTDGTIVYQARALYNEIFNTVKVYNDVNCALFGFSFRENQTNEEGTTESNLLTELNSHESKAQQKFGTFVYYEVYPNPASDRFKIMSNSNLKGTLVEIFDVNRKLLFSKLLEGETNTETILPGLINGVYFVNLTNAKGDKTVRKLVIAY